MVIICPFDETSHSSLELLFFHFQKCLKGRNLAIYFCNRDFAHVFGKQELRDQHIQNCKSQIQPNKHPPELSELVYCRMNPSDLKNLGALLANSGWFSKGVPVIPMSYSFMPPNPALPVSLTQNTYKTNQKNETKLENTLFLNSKSTTQLQPCDPTLEYTHSAKLSVFDPSSKQLDPIVLCTNDPCPNLLLSSSCIFIKIANDKLNFVFQEIGSQNIILIEKFVTQSVKLMNEFSIATILEDDILVYHKGHIEDVPPLSKLAKRTETLFIKVTNSELIFFQIFGEHVGQIFHSEKFLFQMDQLVLAIHQTEQKYAQVTKEKNALQAKLQYEEGQSFKFNIDKERAKQKRLKSERADLISTLESLTNAKNAAFTKDTEKRNRFIDEQFSKGEQKSLAILEKLRNENKALDFELNLLVKSKLSAQKDFAEIEQEFYAECEHEKNLDRQILQAKNEINSLKSKMMSEKAAAVQNMVAIPSLPQSESLCEYEHCCFLCRVKIVDMINYPCKHLGLYCSQCWRKTPSVEQYCDSCCTKIEKILIVNFG